MKKIQRILFPIDFSERSTAAAPHVGGWAQCFSAEIAALHVVDPADYFDADERNSGKAMAELNAIAVRRERDLDYFCGEQFPAGVAVSKSVVTGDTAAVLLAVAQRKETDLVMLPRDHQSIGSRLLRDSLTGRMLHSCAAPVWFTEHFDCLPSIPLRRVLCAIHVAEDLTLDAENERLLDFVRVVAEGFGASVTCLYVSEAGERFLSEALNRPGGLAGVGERLASIQLEMRDVAEFETKTGGVRRAILEAARQREADLLMVGRSRPGTVALGVQGHLLEIDHGAPCPVLSVF